MYLNGSIEWIENWVMNLMVGHVGGRPARGGRGLEHDERRGRVRVVAALRGMDLNVYASAKKQDETICSVPV